jgi:hypothetical protein
MDEEIRYPVCPHRNVPAAFERFFGPDSGGLERFFPEARSFRLDDTVWEVRMKGRRVFALLSDGAILAHALSTFVSAAAVSRIQDAYRALQGRVTLITKTAA